MTTRPTEFPELPPGGYVHREPSLLRRAAPGAERVLYFGLRDPASDFLYAEELGRWQAEGRLTRLRTAVSRAARGLRFGGMAGSGHLGLAPQSADAVPPPPA